MSGIHHVVVVDDDEDTLEIVRSVLEDAGHDVVALTSGADALAFLAQVPDRCLVLLDLRMPDISGWEVLSMLRRADGGGHAVVIVTGMANGLPRGTPALRKPFTKEQLLDVVRQYV